MTVLMLLPGACLILIVPLVPLPGIKWRQPLALTPLIWWLSRSMYKQVALVVLLDSLHRFVVPKLLALIVFAQDISSDENAYVFPTFVLIDPLLKYLCSQRC